MRHSKMMLTNLDGQLALFVHANSSRRSRRSVEHGNPSDEVKEWARNILRVTKHNGHIAMTDGATFRVDRRRRRLHMLSTSYNIALHTTVFKSVGWRIVEGRPSVLN